MMMRARKRHTEDDPRGDSDKKGYQSSYRPGKTYVNEPILPLWCLVGTVAFFLFLGFATEHYKNSRGSDPFAGRNLSNLAGKGGSHVDLKSRYGSSDLTPAEDNDLEYHLGERYHVIFSTDCSPYQHWQSYLVYYTAMKVRQPGHITRIVSGCAPDEAIAMEEWFNEKVQFMSKRFHLHMTPKFSEVKDESGNVVGDYKFFNKPKGLKHFLENFQMLEYSPSSGSFAYEDDIVILIDPDMPLLRPITGDFSNERETVIGKRRQSHVLSDKVKRGIPFGQTYGLGTQWQKFDLEKIAGSGTPAKDVTKEQGGLYFPAGPPYLGTVHDMHQIAVKWSEFVPHVHEQYPYLLAEMYAYCIAAAHLGLQHQLIDSLMVSNPDTGGEGWELVDRIPADEMCEFAAHPEHEKFALPVVAHLCQRYCVGEDWFFGKRKIPHDIYECPTPLFIEPPADLATKFDFKKPPNAEKKTMLSPKIIKQHTFMVCFLTTLINEASTFYKTNACAPGTANLKKSRTVSQLFTEYSKKEL